MQRAKTSRSETCGNCGEQKHTATLENSDSRGSHSDTRSKAATRDTDTDPHGWDGDTDTAQQTTANIEGERTVVRRCEMSARFFPKSDQQVAPYSKQYSGRTGLGVQNIAHSRFVMKWTVNGLILKKLFWYHSFIKALQLKGSIRVITQRLAAHSVPCHRKTLKLYAL